ncbi:hypothetical protein [Enterococcus faecium]
MGLVITLVDHWLGD